MEMYAITTYVIAQELLGALKIYDNYQSLMSNAEVMTFAIVTAKFFSGNFKMSRYMCKKINLFPNLLSNSRLNIIVLTWKIFFKKRGFDLWQEGDPKQKIA